jgi:hypothetical protein
MLVRSSLALASGWLWPAVVEPGYVRLDLASCGRAMFMWHVGFNFSQNVYIPMRFTAQLVDL